jgi:hypothetical protein
VRFLCLIYSYLHRGTLFQYRLSNFHFVPLALPSLSLILFWIMFPCIPPKDAYNFKSRSDEKRTKGRIGIMLSFLPGEL